MKTKYQKSKTKICPTCGKEFYYKHINNTFCSIKCGVKGRKGKTAPNSKEVKCKICGKIFLLKGSKLKDRIIFFCSKECYAIQRSEWMKNPNKNPTYGIGHSIETRKKLSKIASKRLIDGKDNNQRTSKARKRKDLNDIFFRSSWESNFARYLNYIGEVWKYEPKTFFFEGYKRGSLSYTPDFYLSRENVWIEVKGWMDSKSKTKLKRFKEQFSKEASKMIFVINQNKGKAYDFLNKTFPDNEIIYYNELEKKYKNIISNWELPNNSSKKRKNYHLMNKAIKKLDDLGCLVIPIYSLNILDKQMFELFNIATLHQDGGVCLIQVTSTKPHVHYHYENFSRKFHKTGIVMQQWCWINYKGFKVFTYKNGEKTVEKYI